MGLVLKCLFTLCCDGDEEQPESYEPSLSSSPNARMQVAGSSAHHAVSRTTMSRGAGGRLSGTSALLDAQQSYQIAPQGSQDEDDEGGSNNSRAANRTDDAGPAGIFRSHPCCGSSGDGETRHRPPPPSSSGAAAAGLPEFFRRIRDRFRMYDSLEPTDHHHLVAAAAAAASASPASADLKRKLSSLPPPSPLRQASSFDSSRDIPVISKDEVVLPGSELQKQMAVWQSKTLERLDDECVICMEGFDPSNPRMPTMCGCGENKTFFHLPCLYQWVEQCEECPSCRQKLVWEEF